MIFKTSLLKFRNIFELLKKLDPSVYFVVFYYFCLEMGCFNTQLTLFFETHRHIGHIVFIQFVEN
jgi:hypothetical protein